jgi:transcriptional/translational regulatory protein YebC/TACO1
MWEPGSVSWQFKEKGVIYLSWKIEKTVEKGKKIEKILPLNEEELEETLLELDIEDYEIDEEWKMAKIITPKESFATVKKQLENFWYKLEDAGIEFVPENQVEVDDITAEKVQKLIDALEEDDDVDTVYHNMR